MLTSTNLPKLDRSFHLRILEPSNNLLKTLGKLTTFFVWPLDWSFRGYNVRFLDLWVEPVLTQLRCQMDKDCHTYTHTTQHKQTRTHAHTIHPSNHTGMEVIPGAKLGCVGKDPNESIEDQ